MNSDEDEEPLLENSERKTKWKNSRTGLIQFWTVTILTIINYVQVYALIASLALTWTFPESYTKNTYWVFLFNLDVWEFAKVASGEYIAQSKTPMKSNQIMNDQFYIWYIMFILIHWGSMILYSLAMFFGNKNAKLKNNLLPRLRLVGLITWFIFIVPVGVNYSKVFWCLPWTGKMDVANDHYCWTDASSKGYIIISSLSMSIHLILIPIYLAVRIKQNVVTPRVRAHESYLLRRELELEFNINNKFYTEKIYLFSLFRRRQAYFIPIEAGFKVLLIMFYCAFYSISDDPTEQSFYGSKGKLISSCGIFFLILLKFIYDLFRWPYRPLILNVLHWITLIALIAIQSIGFLLNVPDLENAMLTPNYVNTELIVINCLWLGFVILWLVYVGFKINRRRIWPSLYSKTDKPYLMGQNDRFVDALEDATKVLHASQKVVPLFAPAHQLKFQILKINALTREAEYYCELLHPTLQECLQMLTETYAEVSKISIFSTVASNMNKTKIAEELMDLVPDFAKALDKRDYDLALSRAAPKRALLKITAMAAFRQAGAKRTFNRSTSNLTDEHFA